MSSQNNNPKLRRVAIVEDDSGLREQLERILKSAPGVCCAGALGSGEKALAGMVAVEPDVILMDINLPGMSGIECVARLRKDLPSAHVIMLTVYEDSDRIFQALQAGADGSPMSSHIARKVVRQFREVVPSQDEAANLSPREREVLNLLARGFVYKEIGEQLGIGTETVKTYVKNTSKKLHVRNRLEAVARFGHQ